MVSWRDASLHLCFAARRPFFCSSVWRARKEAKNKGIRRKNIEKNLLEASLKFTSTHTHEDRRFGGELIKFFAAQLLLPTGSASVYCQHVTRLGLMGLRASGELFLALIFGYLFCLPLQNELIICNVILDLMKMEQWKIAWITGWNFSLAKHLRRWAFVTLLARMCTLTWIDIFPSCFPFHSWGSCASNVRVFNHDYSSLSKSHDCIWMEVSQSPNRKNHPNSFSVKVVMKFSILWRLMIRIAGLLFFCSAFCDSRCCENWKKWKKKAEVFGSSVTLQRRQRDMCMVVQVLKGPRCPSANPRDRSFWDIFFDSEKTRPVTTDDWYSWAVTSLTNSSPSPFVFFCFSFTSRFKFVYWR